MATKLVSQIGQYFRPEKDVENVSDAEFVATRFTDQGQQELYLGIDKYHHEYAEKIKNYQTAHPTAPNNTSDNKQYFRQELVNYIERLNESDKGNFQGKAEDRAANPEKATVTMTDFLGPEGTELYRLALEEEMNSKEYMDAVVRNSTEHYDGQKWTQRPVVIVGGPSASGKTFAANAAVQKADQFLPKDPNNNSGNDVVAVDGGKAREVSQMRKLVIQAANNKGFSGISDLHSQSKVLESVKDRVRNSVFKTPSLGVVIPETFSSYINPFSKNTLLQQVIDLPNTKPVFCRVDGENPSIFRKVVGFMGSRRAWKTSGFDSKAELDLNNTNIAESKAYGAGGFNPGKWGSIRAENWFKRHCNDNLTILIKNDLLLKKESPAGSQNWIDAQQGEKGSILVAKRVFDTWQTMQNELSPEQRKSNEGINLPEFSKAVSSSLAPPLMETSCEIELQIAKSAITRSLENRTKEQQKQKDPVKAEQMSANNQQLKSLASNLSLLKQNQINKKDIDTVLAQVGKQFNGLNDAGFFNKDKKTKDAIEKAMTSYRNISIALQTPAETEMAIAIGKINDVMHDMDKSDDSYLYLNAIKSVLTNCDVSDQSSFTLAKNQVQSKIDIMRTEVNFKSEALITSTLDSVMTSLDTINSGNYANKTPAANPASKTQASASPPSNPTSFVNKFKAALQTIKEERDEKQEQAAVESVETPKMGR